jgi:hypothetical protein
MNQECYEQNMDEAPSCGICDVNMRKKMTKKTQDTASALYAETADFDCICDTCWPHYLVASMALAKVLGSQVARAKRGQL